MRSREEVEQLMDLLGKVSEVFWSLSRMEPAVNLTVENEFFTVQVEERGHSADVYVRGKDYCLGLYIASYDEGPVDEARLAAKILRWALGESVKDDRCVERFECARGGGAKSIRKAGEGELEHEQER
jgi:hypothetical protein